MGAKPPMVSQTLAPTTRSWNSASMAVSRESRVTSPSTPSTANCSARRRKGSFISGSLLSSASTPSRRAMLANSTICLVRAGRSCFWFPKASPSILKPRIEVLRGVGHHRGADGPAEDDERGGRLEDRADVPAFQGLPEEDEADGGDDARD